MVFAQILNFTQRVGLHSDSVRNGDWVNSIDLMYRLTPQIELAGKTLGIIGFGADVLSTEPPMPRNPLLSAKNCFITPHIAWATKEARLRLMRIAVDNIRKFLEGNPVNVVNP